MGGKHIKRGTGFLAGRLLRANRLESLSYTFVLVLAVVFLLAYVFRPAAWGQSSIGTGQGLGATPNGPVPAVVISIPNNTTTGTVLNQLVSLDSSGNAIQTAANAANGVHGICIGTCGTSGSAQVQILGPATCSFTNTPAINDYAQVSSTAGKCVDSGASTWPTSGGEVIGAIKSASGVVDLTGPDVSGGGGTTNLNPYTGAVAVTGNRTTGADVISSVNWNGFIDPRTYGAKCDNSTDDTAALNSAIADGRSIMIPEGKVCVVSTSLTIGASFTGFTLAGQHKEETVSSVGPSSGKITGLRFTAAPAACSAGSGGRLNINGSYSIVVRDMDLLFEGVGVPANCDIYIYNSSRITFERVHITNPSTYGSPLGSAVNTTAVQWEQSTSSYFDNNIIDAGFARMIYAPDTTSPASYLNAVGIIRNRFGAPPLAYEYLPLVDIQTGNMISDVRRPQNVWIENNVFEQAPQGIRILNGGYGIDIGNSYMADGYGANNSWSANRIFGPATTCGCLNVPVNSTGGTTGATTNFQMCPTTTAAITGTCGVPTAGGCNSGASAPTWPYTPGGSVTETATAPACTWYNEGPGIGIELQMRGGHVHDNQISLGNLVALKLDVGSAGIEVIGNKIGNSVKDAIEDYGTANHIGANHIPSSSSRTITSAFVVAGAASRCTGAGTSTSSTTEAVCTGVANTGNTRCFSDSVCSAGASGMNCTAWDNPNPCCTGSGTGNCCGQANVIDAVDFYDSTSNTYPFVCLSSGSSGSLMYDTNELASSRLIDVSGGRWIIADPLGGFRSSSSIYCTVAASISGGGALSAGSNCFAGRMTGVAASSNVLTPGFTCPNAVQLALTDDTTAGGAKVTAQSPTTATFSATAADIVDYIASCR